MFVALWSTTLCVGIKWMCKWSRAGRRPYAFIKETQVPFNDGVAKALEQLRQQLKALRGDIGSLSSNTFVATKRLYSYVDERCDALRSVRHRQSQSGFWVELELKFDSEFNWTKWIFWFGFRASKSYWVWCWVSSFWNSQSEFFRIECFGFCGLNDSANRNRRRIWIWIILLELLCFDAVGG